MLARLRKVGPTSLGITFDKNLIEELDLKDGDLIEFTDINVIKKPISYHYKCGVCYCEFNEDCVNEIECPGCGEMQNIITVGEAEE